MRRTISLFVVLLSLSEMVWQAGDPLMVAGVIGLFIAYLIAQDPQTGQIRRRQQALSEDWIRGCVRQELRQPYQGVAWTWPVEADARGTKVVSIEQGRRKAGR